MRKYLITFKTEVGSRISQLIVARNLAEAISIVLSDTMLNSLSDDAIVFKIERDVEIRRKPAITLDRDANIGEFRTETGVEATISGKPILRYPQFDRSDLMKKFKGEMIYDKD